MSSLRVPRASCSTNWADGHGRRVSDDSFAALRVASIPDDAGVNRSATPSRISPASRLRSTSPTPSAKERAARARREVFHSRSRRITRRSRTGAIRRVRFGGSVCRTRMKRRSSTGTCGIRSGRRLHEVAPHLVQPLSGPALLLASDRCSVYCRFCTRSAHGGAGRRRAVARRARNGVSTGCGRTRGARRDRLRRRSGSS